MRRHFKNTIVLNNFYRCGFYDSVFVQSLNFAKNASLSCFLKRNCFEKETDNLMIWVCIRVTNWETCRPLSRLIRK